MRLAEAGQISLACAEWPSRSLAPVIFLDRRAAARCGRPPTTPGRRSTPSGPGRFTISSTATRRSITRCCCPKAPARKLADAAALWNAAEAAERRKDAQLAREIVLALPANAELTTEDRIELARRFAIENFVSKGLAVQLDVHAPHAGDSESERANWHAHLLITTRRVEGEGFAAKKARDLEPEIKRIGGRAVVSEGEAWGEVWRALQNRYFAEQGLEIRVDVRSAVAQAHIGPIRMRAADAEANGRADEIARANAKAARDPDQVLATLTRNNATFTERDLERHLAKHIGDLVEREAVKGRVLGHNEVLALHDRETGESVGRFTTRTVRAQERQALADAAEVAAARTGRVSARAKAEALENRALRADQLAALKYTVGEGGLKIIEGRAGTGKSFTLAAIREAHERSGHEVIGLAPTNAVAQDLRGEGGFARAGTVHAELFRIKNGLTTWSRGTVVMVDEAAMLDSRVMGELFAEAKRAEAKLILAGDDRQLASIERGGLFAELRQRHGSVAITEVTRQNVDWQRQAARDLAEGRFEDALRAFAREKAITWTAKQDEARTALVAAWRRDTAKQPEKSAFRVRLHEQGCRPPQCRAPDGAKRERRARARPPLRDEARCGGFRGRRPGAVHRHAESGPDL